MENEAVTADGEDSQERVVLGLPLSRVKRIIKYDQDIRLISSESIRLISLAAELFLESITGASADMTISQKRVTIQRRDILGVIQKQKRFRDCIGNSLGEVQRTEKPVKKAKSIELKKPSKIQTNVKSKHITAFFLKNS